MITDYEKRKAIEEAAAGHYDAWTNSLIKRRYGCMKCGATGFYYSNKHSFSIPCLNCGESSLKQGEQQ